ncbi:MAG: DUF4398 domain-containing protein [Gammaproteobacteria bacterium]
MSVRNGFLVAAVIGLLSAGCATQSGRPTAEITRARTLIEQAERSGAQRYAALELDNARDKLRQADAAVADGKHDVARERANEAAADAELAAAKASSGAAQQTATDVQKGTDTLQREADRNAGVTPPNNP